MLRNCTTTSTSPVDRRPLLCFEITFFCRFICASLVPLSVFAVLTRKAIYKNAFFGHTQQHNAITRMNCIEHKNVYVSIDRTQLLALTTHTHIHSAEIRKMYDKIGKTHLVRLDRNEKIPFISSAIDKSQFRWLAFDRQYFLVCTVPSPAIAAIPFGMLRMHALLVIDELIF